ncbi:MAG: PAS domain S-box protein [Planctomycetes bacterium]|nr:PAS domain S-box protein [Planctomycetota bacterium]
MSTLAQDVLSERVVTVDAAAPLREASVDIHERRASHVAIFTQGRCQGVSSLNGVDLSSDNRTFGDLIEGFPLATVSGETSLEELGRLFADAKVEGQVVHNELGEFVGVVTRQSLLETLINEGNQPVGSLRRSNVTEHKQVDSLLALEGEIFERILTSTSQSGWLKKLVEATESLSDGMFCAIQLLDEDGLRLRNGASLGLPDEFIRAVDGLEIGLNSGCCASAAFLNQSVIVSDIASEPAGTTFRDLAMKHGLRACWSVPIRSTRGKVLGTFAMYYGEPRSPDSYQENLIGRAARLAAIAISQRDSEYALIRSEQQLRKAQQIAHVGSFELAADGSPTYWSDECFRIVGLEPTCEIPSRAQFLEQILHPDDLELSRQTVWPSLNRGGAYSYEYRIRRPDGSIRWVHARGKSNCDASGQIVSVMGTIQDITDSKLATDSVRELNIALSNAMPGISRLDTAGHYVEVNDHYADALGYEPNELIGADWSPTVHPDDVSIAIRAYEDMCQDGKGEFEARAVRKDGSLFQKRVLMVRIDNSGGVMTGHHCFMRDVTERKQVDDALRASELRLKTVISDAPVVIMSIDLSGQIDLFDGRALESVGFQPGQFVGENYFELWKDRPYMTRSMRECLAGNTPASTTMDIADRLLETRYSPLRAADGQVTGATTVCVDITERVRAEEELRANHNLLTSVMEGTTDAVFVKDEKGRYLMVNSAGARIIGKRVEEIIGKDDTQLFPLDEARIFQATDRSVMASDELLTVEEAAPSAEYDTSRTFLTTKAPYRNHEGRIAGVIGIAHDITDRKQDEEALRKSETRSRTLLEGSPICTKIIDLDSRLQYMSCAGQKQLKISDINPFYGSTFPPELYPESWRAVVNEHLERAKAGEISSLDCPVLDTDGREIWFDTTFVPARDKEGRIEYIIVTSVNITERTRAEDEARRYRDELAHVSRISTIGEMATGVAHELNQPLAAIASYSYVAKSIVDQFHPDSDKLQDTLGKLEDQAIRAGDIVRRLRDFVKKNESVHVLTDICTLVRNVATFVKPDICQAEATLELNFERPSLQVRVDEIQIQQVVVNLIRNALDAMHETPTTQRKVAVSVRVLPDGRVEVAVRDAGKGLSSSELEQVFNAFFSTKQEGMGMGLAISRSIVEAHSGKLWAKPNSGLGATFGFMIPYEPEISTGELCGDPTVFIVDDEAVVRDSLCVLLQAMGYRAECFASASDFIERFEPHDVSGAAILIADVQMPEISGIELLERLGASGSTLPVIITTGHGGEALKRKAENLGAAAFLEKPFRPAQLQEVITTILKRIAGEKHAA